MSTVQWIENEFVKLESTVGVYMSMYEIIEKAKSMEEQQSYNDYMEGYQKGWRESSIELRRLIEILHHRFPVSETLH